MGLRAWLRGRREPRAGERGSVTSTVAGRERVVGVPYLLPKDIEELNRLDFQHFMLRFALKGNYAAPLDTPQRILDVGCGTGRWAAEMAQVFPQAQVTGLDITPPPSDHPLGAESGQRPANVTFTIGNALEGLPFPDNSFDYTHMRLLVTAIPADRWGQVVRELARVTRPGGWVESVESVPARDGGPAMDAIFGWLSQISLRRGVDLAQGAHVADRMREAGLANVSAREVGIPIGRYGGRVGAMMVTDTLSGFRAVGGVLVAQGMTTEPQFQQTLDQLTRDLNGRRWRCYSPFTIALGQKV